MSIRNIWIRCGAIVLCVLAAPVLGAQTVPAQGGPPPAATRSPSAEQPAQASPTSELQTGTALTRRGLLREAIPHLLAAQSAGSDPYAVGVNLGICYLGTESYKQAIAVLEALRAAGHRTTVVDNLLAQSYLGDGQTGPALQVFQEAAAAAPKDEKLYAFMADACTDRQDYSLGLRVVDRGLRQLPNSARLHYERALFLARLDRFDEAKPEFDRAAQIAPDSYIGYLALVQKDLYEDNLPEATRVLRQAIKAGHRDYQMLSLLGSVLLFEGAVPGQPQFAEAQAALEESARDRPDYSATQIALGKLYLRAGRYKDAAVHLEIGRRLEPNNPSVYASLASAYNRLGERDKAREMDLQVGRLLAEKKAVAAQPRE
ncbi:MAG: tetratricopeptide repeat protein [Acidobacteriaceae bacterium]